MRVDKGRQREAGGSEGKSSVSSHKVAQGTVLLQVKFWLLKVFYCAAVQKNQLVDGFIGALL